MAKPAYPGLVVVPPSDRWLFRRRLARWAVLLIGITSCASTLGVWLPSGNDSDCIENTTSVGSYDRGDTCGQPSQSVTEALQNRDQAAGTQAVRVGDESSSDDHRSPLSSDSDQQTAADVSGPASKLTGQKRTVGPKIDTYLAKQGDAFAQYRLGRFFAQRGEAHSQESAAWYIKASHGLRRLANTGNGEAMYVLGVMNAFGRGVAKDQEKARRWLIQAVEHRVAAARPVLERLEKRLGTDSSLQASVQMQRVRHEN